MLRKLRLVFARELPHQGELAFCLLRDPRIGTVHKSMLAASLLAIYSPFIDLPSNLPVIGELDVAVLTLLALRLFIQSCPKDVVDYHERALRQGTSTFHGDLHRGTDTLRATSARLRQWSEQMRVRG